VSKEFLRSELLRKLSALSHDEIQGLSFSLTNQIIKFFKSNPALTSQIGAGYLPLKAEIAPVYQELLRGVPLTIAYPILKGELMSFAIPDGLARVGIWLDAPFKEVTPDWLLIPGLGFDLQGGRLGRGKGFYDRYLEDTKVTKIALAWSEQIVESVPVESHDCRMDFIITENFCWDIKQQIKC
jgi:5-formyltetrahydrofolate cyclo-ligase